MQPGCRGISPKKMCMTAFFISGAIAGLAGFTEINGMQHMLLTGFESDIGSYGIGIAIMASANPIGVIFAALLFGTLQEAVQHWGIPQMLRPALLTLCLVLLCCLC